MSEKLSGDRIAIIVLGILLALVGTISGIVWSKVDRTESTVESNLPLIKDQLQRLAADRDVDIEQNRRLDSQRNTDRKFWRLHHWVKTELNKQNAMDSEPLAEWPDLDVE